MILDLSCLGCVGKPGKWVSELFRSWRYNQFIFYWRLDIILNKLNTESPFLFVHLKFSLYICVMTVKELQSKLSKYPPYLQVMITPTYAYGNMEITDVDYIPTADDDEPLIVGLFYDF